MSAVSVVKERGPSGLVSAVSVAKERGTSGLVSAVSVVKERVSSWLGSHYCVDTTCCGVEAIAVVDLTSLVSTHMYTGAYAHTSACALIYT